MRVFRVDNDVNHYQYFLPEKEEDALALCMDCTPRAGAWSPPNVYIYRPKHKRGDFYQFANAALITSPRATEMLHTHLVEAGELLPVPYEGQVFTLLNVLACADCLDRERSIPRPGSYESFVFRPDAVAQLQSTVFKIPETCRADLLVVEGLRAPEAEFRAVVEATGLRGLVFELLWERA